MRWWNISSSRWSILFYMKWDGRWDGWWWDRWHGGWEMVEHETDEMMINDLVLNLNYLSLSLSINHLPSTTIINHQLPSHQQPSHLPSHLIISSLSLEYHQSLKRWNEIFQLSILNFSDSFLKFEMMYYEILKYLWHDIVNEIMREGDEI